MSKDHPVIVTIKDNLEESECHNCGNPLELVTARCGHGKATGVVYCKSCDELSNATFVLEERKVE